VLAAAGVSAGIGFTVSLLIASLAFHGAALDEAKLGVLATVVLAPALSWVAVKVISMVPAPVRARQIGRTAEDILDLAQEVDPDRDHIRGPDDAPVTLVEYGDFECPYCGQAEQVIRKLLSSAGSDVRYVWRPSAPERRPPDRAVRAEAAEAAAAQDRFWDMHDILLSNQDALSPRDLARYAEELGLDIERFRDELRRREFASRVSDDVASADESGVSGTRPSSSMEGATTASTTSTR